jgi:hypothetical protein
MPARIVDLSLCERLPLAPREVYGYGSPGRSVILYKSVRILQNLLDEDLEPGYVFIIDSPL